MSELGKNINVMDMIYRQAAIDAVDSETVSTNPEHFKSNEKFIKFMDDSDISSFGKWQWANGFNTALVATRIHLKKLPSTQPDQPPYVAEIESEYRKAVNMPYIKKPLAKALYEVWKKHDRDDAERKE